VGVATVIPADLAELLVSHGSLIDYIAVSGTMERNVLEYTDHLHEHFLYPCSINKGRYNVPNSPAEGYRLCIIPIVWLEILMTLLPVVSRCTSRASQSMSGQMGHIGQRQRRHEGEWIINYQTKAFYLYLVGIPIYLYLIGHYLRTYVAVIRLLLAN
jgi:hypothetical protein